jgi:hypothetical protein
MRIYTEIVWSWDDERGELVKESSKFYDYDGPLTLAYGAGVAQTIQQNQASASNEVKGTYPLGVGGSSDDFPHYIRFTAKRSGPADATFAAGEVVLYMPPDALKTSYSQNIGDIDMGTAIQIAEGSGNTTELQDALEVKTGFDPAAILNKVASLVTASGGVALDTAKAAALAIGSAAIGGTAVAAIGKATGQIINPHKAVVYQGPGGFRTFSYTFVMVPKSEKEAEQISNIVRFFKERMHPSVGAGGIDAIKSFTLGYPDEFTIKYYVNKKDIDANVLTPLFRIHDCFCTSFGVDYTTSSLVSFIGDDVQPLTTTMSLAFKETQLITKQDIRDGY